MASIFGRCWLRSARGMATAATEAPGPRMAKAKRWPRGDFVPVYVALGMILVSMSLGAYTLQEQLVHSPSVRVNKKRRETVPEVEDPDRIADEASRYVKHSLFRKVAYKQDLDAFRAGISDPTRAKDLSHIPARMETLKSVGVEPRANAA